MLLKLITTLTLMTMGLILIHLSMQPIYAQGSVTTTGNPNQNGSSWANATTLTNALSIAFSGDEIWVASFGGKAQLCTPQLSR